MRTREEISREVNNMFDKSPVQAFPTQLGVWHLEVLLDIRELLATPNVDPFSLGVSKHLKDSLTTNN